MGAVSRALRDAAIANGATVRTDAAVARIDVRNGRVRGVTLESGEELRADVVVAATHPQITFLRPHRRAAVLPTDFVDRIEALALAQRHREGERRRRPAARSSRPSPGSIPRCTAARSCWRNRSTTSRARSRTRWPAARPTLPFADICIPSVFDPTLAPEGKHVVSMFTQWVPHTYAGGTGPGRARRVRRSGHRARRSGRAGLHRARSCTAR